MVHVLELLYSGNLNGRMEKQPESFQIFITEGQKKEASVV